MADTTYSGQESELQTLRAEVARLNKVVKALMDRAERSTNAQSSDFGKFQTSIMLEDQVRRRTAELEAAFRENERIQGALQESESRFRGLVNQSLVGIAIIEDGWVTYANPKLLEMFGYTVEEMEHLTLLDIATENEGQIISSQLHQRLQGNADAFLFHGRRKDGAIIDIESYSSMTEKNGKTVLIGMMVDVTKRVQAERKVLALQDQLREQAIRDSLTGLYNRLPLNEFFDRELHRATRSRRTISVVMGDLDHFKVVNDTYGHQAGDETLRVFGDLIRQTYRASDIPCRYGGEEFLILLPDMSIEQAYRRTEHLRVLLETTAFAYGAAPVHVTASFGVAIFPQDGRTRDELIAAADRALYAAKHHGRNRIKIYSAMLATA